MTPEEIKTKADGFFDKDGRLTAYPKKQPVRQEILSRLAEKFEAGRLYTEKEINAIIDAAITFGDIELIRRELIDFRFLSRKRDGSQYWKEEKNV